MRIRISYDPVRVWRILLVSILVNWFLFNLVVAGLDGPECVDINLQTGWNLISTPFATEDIPKDVNLYGAAPNGFIKVKVISPGYGYWVYSDKNRTLRICGKAESNDITIHLENNTNIYVGPLTDMKVDYLRNHVSGKLNVYSYVNKKWIPVNRMIMGEGYLLTYVGPPVNITLPRMMSSTEVDHCVSLTDPSTWDDKIDYDEMTRTYTVLKNITLCRGEYFIYQLRIDNPSDETLVFDGNGSVLRLSNMYMIPFKISGNNIIFKNTIITGDRHTPPVILEDGHKVIIQNTTFNRTSLRIKGTSRNILFMNNTIIDGEILFEDIDSSSLEYMLIYNSVFITPIDTVQNPAIFVNHGAERDDPHPSVKKVYILNNTFINWSWDDIYLDRVENIHIQCNKFIDLRPLAVGTNLFDDNIDLNRDCYNITIENNTFTIYSPSPNAPHGGVTQFDVRASYAPPSAENVYGIFRYNTVYYNSSNGHVFSIYRINVRNINITHNKFFIHKSSDDDFSSSPPYFVKDSSNLHQSVFSNNIICGDIRWSPFNSDVVWENNTCDWYSVYDCVRDCSTLSAEDYRPYGCEVDVEDVIEEVLNETPPFPSGFVGEVAINPDQGELNTLRNLYCVINISSDANDSVVVEWYRNGELYTSTEMMCTEDPESSSQYCTYEYIPNSETRKHENWTCNVIATYDDGEVARYNDSRVIEDAQPIFLGTVYPNSLDSYHTYSPVNLDWDDVYDPDVEENTDTIRYNIFVSGPTSLSVSGLRQSYFGPLNLDPGEYTWTVQACDDDSLCVSTSSRFIVDSISEDVSVNLTKIYNTSCSAVGEPVSIELNYSVTPVCIDSTIHRSSNASTRSVDYIFLVNHNHEIPFIEYYEPFYLIDVYSSTYDRWKYFLPKGGEIFLYYKRSDLVPSIPSIYEINLTSPSGITYSTRDGSLNCSIGEDVEYPVQCELSYTKFEPGWWVVEVSHSDASIRSPNIIVSQSVENVKRSVDRMFSSVGEKGYNVSYLIMSHYCDVVKDLGPVDFDTDIELIDNLRFDLSRNAKLSDSLVWLRGYLPEDDNLKKIILITDGNLSLHHDHMSNVELEINRLISEGDVELVVVQPFTSRYMTSDIINLDNLREMGLLGGGGYYTLNEIGDWEYFMREFDIFMFEHDLLCDPIIGNVSILDEVNNSHIGDYSGTDCDVEDNNLICNFDNVSVSGSIRFTVYPDRSGENISLNGEHSGIIINWGNDTEDFISFGQPKIKVCPEGFICSPDGECVPHSIGSRNLILNARVSPRPAVVEDSLYCQIQTNVIDRDGTELHVKWYVKQPGSEEYVHVPEYDSSIHVDQGLSWSSVGPVTGLRPHQEWMCVPYFIASPNPDPDRYPTTYVLNRPPNQVIYLPSQNYTCFKEKTIYWLSGGDPDNDPISNYFVYFGEYGEPLELIRVFGNRTTQMTFRNLIPGHRYCYRVDAFDGELSSDGEVRCFDVRDSCSCPYIDYVNITNDMVNTYTCHARVLDPRRRNVIVSSGRPTKPSVFGLFDFILRKFRIIPSHENPTYDYLFVWNFEGSGEEHIIQDELHDMTTLTPSDTRMFSGPLDNITCTVCVLCCEDGGDSDCEWNCLNATHPPD